jgi:two-component system alkaline phosphatase synthesis response regulator PhoP
MINTVQKRILIIEDDKSVLQLIRMYLVNDGFTVIDSYDGSDGLNKTLTETPDLVLLDLNLPKMDGIEVCQKIRSSSDLPIIMVTARVDELDKLDGLEKGADDYMTKPFSPRELVARVKAVLRRTQKDIESNKDEPLQIRSKEIVINTESRSINVNEQPVSITPTEYRLACYLLKSTGRVISREQIIENVFGYDFSGYDRTVDTHISNLRKKLERAGARKGLFSTVYGMGYRFDGDIS